MNRIATVAAAKNTTQVRDDQYVSTQTQGTQQVKNQGMADPFAGSRTFAAMLVALVIGSAAAGLSALTLADVKAQGENTRRYAELSGQSFVPEGTGFYERAYQLVGYAVLVAMVIAAAGLLVALADGILARRRALASLVATGASRGPSGPRAQLAGDLTRSTGGSPGDAGRHAAAAADRPRYERHRGHGSVALHTDAG